MSEAMKLSDEVLDAIAGGRITMGGQEVTGLFLNGKGPVATIGGKNIQLEWSDAFIAKAQAEGKTYVDVAFELSAKGNSSTTYTLEEYVKTPA